MRKLSFYLNDRYKIADLKNYANKCKPLRDCDCVKDYLNRGKALIVAKDYFGAFISYEWATSTDLNNFEARLGEYKAWYLFSKTVNEKDHWDPQIDDLYRNLVFHTPEEYKLAVEAMYENDKRTYQKEEQ